MVEHPPYTRQVHGSNPCGPTFMTSGQTIYILPGAAGRQHAYWYMWLTRELRRCGYTVQLCSQNRLDPGVRARQLSRRYTLGPGDVLVGHSFGGLTALKWLEYRKQKIAGLVLVDVSVKSAFESIPPALWEKTNTSVERRKLKYRQRKYLHAWDWKLDVELIRQRVVHAVLLSEDQTAHTFVTWRKEHARLAKKIGATLKTGRGIAQHFTARKEPRVLQTVATALSKVKQEG